MHQINKKTLMWYDEIGLFRPAAVAENGYRYYTYYQSALLETILLLRELDMSIPQIKSFLQNRSSERFVGLLRDKIGEVERKITRLQGIRGTLIEREAAFAALLHADLSKIELVEREEEFLYLVGTTDGATMEEDIESVIETAKEHNIKSLRDTSYGALISVDKLQKGDFDRYDGLFLKAVRPVIEKGVHRKPPGMYLRAYCKGSWDNLPQRYREILQYAAGRRWRLAGYSYESGDNEIAIDSMDEYLTRIEILVENAKVPPPSAATENRP